MNTLSAVSAGRQKVFAVGWLISFTTAFLFGFSSHLFKPFSNEFYSILQIALYLFCFSAAALLQPGRKHPMVIPEELLFAVLANLLVYFLLNRPDWSGFTMPLLFLFAGRITGHLNNRVISSRHFGLFCIGGAAAGMLVFYLLNNLIPPHIMGYLFLAALLPVILIPCGQIVCLKSSLWFKTLLAIIWLLIPAQYLRKAEVRHDFPPGTVVSEDEKDTEIKPAAVIQAQLQPNRKNLKILLIGDSKPMIRLLSNPLTRKLSNLSMTSGADIYRKLNAEADDFDLIVLLLPMPRSLYAERLYSVRFCQLLKDHLVEDGVLAVWFPDELLSYSKYYLNDLYGSAGTVFCKVFPQVKPACSDSLVLLCGGGNLTNSPTQLNERAENLLCDTGLLPEKAFLMSTEQEQLENERFFRSEMFRSGGQDAGMCSLLWNAVRNHPFLDRTILGRLMTQLRSWLLFLLAILAAALAVLRYFFSGGTPSKRIWMTWENGIYTGLVVILFLIPCQQYTGRLSRDWILFSGWFLLAAFCGRLLSFWRQQSPLLLKLLLVLSLLLPLWALAFLRGYAPEPLFFYAVTGFTGFSAGAVNGNIRAAVPLIPASIAAGLILGILLFWLPGGIIFALILAILTRIPPASSENLQKQFDKS